MILIRRIVGNSMEPALRHGKIVLAIRRHRYRPSDVVIAVTPQREVIKRIFDIKNNVVYLRGDNANASNSYKVHLSDIKGRII